MFGKHRSEVLVAGAGPVGLFTAAEAVKRGLDVQIVDAEWRGTGMSYATALHPGSVALLRDLGLEDDVVRDAYHVERLVFYEGTERKTIVDLTALGGDHPYLTIMPQSAMEGALERWLSAHKAKVRWRHRLAGITSTHSPTEVTLQRWGDDSIGYGVAHDEPVIDAVFPFQAEFLVGADGHRSLVRRRLEYDFREVVPATLFGVFEFDCKHDLAHEACVVLTEDTTNVLWPLPEGRCRWSFQLRNPAEFEGERVKSRLSALGRWILPSLDEERLHTLIAERAPWFEGGAGEVVWSVAIKFEQRLSSGFGSGALWLAGDAAHIASPVGMHSMNVGLREGRDLAEAFHGILREGAAPEGLETYAAARRAEWTALLDLTESLRASDRATPFVRDNARRILTSIPASGENLKTLLRQVNLEL